MKRAQLKPTRMTMDFGKTAENFAHFPLLQSQRDCVLQPGVARNELPWVTAGERPATPTGLCLLAAAKTDATPLGLVTFLRRFPRLARSSQPWALRRNPFGIRFSKGDSLGGSLGCSFAPRRPQPNTFN